MTRAFDFRHKRNFYNRLARLRKFVRSPWAGGVVLILFTVLALVLANLPWTASAYHHLFEARLRIGFDGFSLDEPLEAWVNDGLMAVFFFYVGLEIKREVIAGRLSGLRQAALPLAAALGGMVFPALIYFAINPSGPYAVGWGVPTATDIAFALGVLSLFGPRVPVSLKVFLTALAVVDDLGAILVIAIFYGGAVKWGFLFLALAIMAGLYGLNRLGETRISYFLIPAFVVWGLFYYSGIHATLSGVAMAMIIPMRPRYSKPYFFRQLRNFTRSLERVREEDERFPDAEQRYYLQRMKDLSYNSIGMSYRLEDLLAPYVTFIIMPIFALANAGVRIDLEYLDIFRYSSEGGAVGMGIFLGLLVGKPLGIFLTSWAAVKSGFAEMPGGVSWRMLLAVACLGGIGFTMSIFVDALAFDEEFFVNQGKIAILLGSLASALLGALLIRVTMPAVKN